MGQRGDKRVTSNNTMVKFNKLLISLYKIIWISFLKVSLFLSKSLHFHTYKRQYKFKQKTRRF